MRRQKLVTPSFQTKSEALIAQVFLTFFGDHAVICGGDCAIHNCHYSIMRDAGANGHFNPFVATTDLLGNRQRPADVFLFNFGNAGLCIDAAVVNALMDAQENRTIVLTKANYSAVTCKKDSCEGIRDDNDHHCSLVFITTLGGFSAGTKWLTDYLAAAQRDVHGDVKSKRYSAWIRRRLEYFILKFQPVLSPYLLTSAGAATLG